MTQFSENPPLDVDRQQEVVRNFLQVSEDKIRGHVLWRDSSDEELDEMSEALERFVLSKIYRVIFAPKGSDLEMDEKLKARIDEISWIEPRHLDIQLDLVGRGSQRVLSLAIEQLRSWNSYKGKKREMKFLLLNRRLFQLPRIRWFVF